METLFALEPAFPPGFSYTENFLTPEEEKKVVAEISTISLHPFTFRGYEAKRKVASFGYDWSFEKQTLTKGKDIPPAFQWVLEKIASFLALPVQDIAELLLTAYPAGSVINWHRDAPPFGVIAGISLLSDCTFRLRPSERARQTRASVLSFPVKRRSLYVMKNEARSEWQHSIAAVKRLRYSLTVRTLK
jgi:alkylated DNA repair dioxygenase AlkB